MDKKSDLLDGNSTFLTGVRLTKRHLKIIEDEMERTGVVSRSEMIRRMLHDWQLLKSNSKESQANRS